MSEKISEWQKSQSKAEKAKIIAIPGLVVILNKIAAEIDTDDLYDAHRVLTDAGYRALEELQRQK